MSFAKEKPKKKRSEDDKPVIVKNTADLQRLKIEKLMKNPDKPVVIPERPKDKNNPHVPEFVRNVMGSSAGAGSGEFHVYRHLRRKEYARQKFIQEKAEKETLEEQYHRRLEENKRKFEDETAKKRAKRLKKKKNKKVKNPKSQAKSESETDEDSEDSNTPAESSGNPSSSHDNVSDSSKVKEESSTCTDPGSENDSINRKETDKGGGHDLDDDYPPRAKDLK